MGGTTIRITHMKKRPYRIISWSSKYGMLINSEDAKYNTKYSPKIKVAKNIQSTILLIEISELIN